MTEERKKYLTIHGHFYQPPRENPWLEAVETQDSAHPFHDWNARVACECYTPNSVSKIVDYKNQILDIVNNYQFMSFNFGPTLMSWLETHSPYTYERIVKADIESSYHNYGHGNAIAQVYNHIIMPLANRNDKYTQILWGIKDFQYRFGRMPEGMWLAETATDDATMEALVDCGIKFTILSPYQAQRTRLMDSNAWNDVSWGTIDPAKPYRYYIKSDSSKYIDIFFYDGAISKSVAFDELLKDGNRFIGRLKDGISEIRNYDQIVNIATDGESYGHHTKFGDMALSYILRIKAKDEGFTITNYANYLAHNEVRDEVEIKPVSSWSCAHGVGRWCDDCGCSTGAQAGWNQKWRKPLRNALDYLRDQLIGLFNEVAPKYFKSPWDARNDYIEVILDRNEQTIKHFFEKNLKPDLEYDDKVKALKLMEIQRQAMLMYTSCGWFFAEISGLETTQIMKYASRAIQLAADFTDRDIESGFTNILAEAKSNINNFGTGKDIYERFVKPSSISVKQIASLWAISSLYRVMEKDISLYCYEITKHSYKKVSKSGTNFVAGRIEIKSKITLEKSDLTFALLQYPDGDFHCAIKEFSNTSEYNRIIKDLYQAYTELPITETIRLIDENFGKEYFTLKDIFIEERRGLLAVLLKDKLKKFSENYREVYNDGKDSIVQLKKLGLAVPQEFKLAAQYTLSQDFNSLFMSANFVENEDIIQKALEINEEAKVFDIVLDKNPTSNFFSNLICKRIYEFAKTFESHRLEKALDMFKIIEKLEVKVDIGEAQNIYFNRIFSRFTDIIAELSQKNDLATNRTLLLATLKLGNCLNINTDFFQSAIIRLTAEIAEKVNI